MKASAISLKAIKGRQNQPIRRSLYTPGPVRGRVIMRHMTGESNRKIAVEEGIDRETVSRILSERGVVQMIAQGQARALSLVPKAIAAFEEILNSDDRHLKAAVGTKLLEGLGVFNKGGIEQTIDIARRAAPELDRKDRECMILGQVMQMAIEKKKRFALAAPELDELETEAKRLIEGPL